MTSAPDLGFAPPTFARHLVRLRLARAVTFPFEHGGVLRGVLSRALERHELPSGLIPVACESGRVGYAAGDAYHLGVTLANEDDALAEELVAGLERLGASRRDGPPPVLGGNFTVDGWERLPPPVFEAGATAPDGPVEMILTAPLRIKRPEELEVRGAGYLNGDCFPARWFLEVLWRRLFFFAHARYPEAAERQASMPAFPEELEAKPGHLLWVDLPIRGTEAKGRPYTLGGVRGRVVFTGLDPAWRRALALGAEAHVGQNTHYAFGRYVLAVPESPARPGYAPAKTFLESAAEEDVLCRALADVRDIAAGTPAEEPPELELLRQELRERRYEPPPLVGRVIPSGDGGLRTLAIPTLRDRVAQRAAAQVLAPAIDTLLEESSAAFRQGHSRQGAARTLDRARADGYRYVLDAGVRDFFEQLDWTPLLAKLRALYPFEPLVDLLEAWVRAPVVFEGRTLDRRCGLPPESPVSATLARLILEDLDEIVRGQGLRLVRLDDDFVVLTRNPTSHPLRR